MAAGRVPRLAFEDSPITRGLEPPRDFREDYDIRWGDSQSFTMHDGSSFIGKQLVNVWNDSVETFSVLLFATIHLPQPAPVSWQFDVRWQVNVGVGNTNEALPYEFFANSAATATVEDYGTIDTPNQSVWQIYQLPARSLQVAVTLISFVGIVPANGILARVTAEAAPRFNLRRKRQR